MNWKGPIVKVSFFDHKSGGPGKDLCESQVVGVLVDQDPNKLLIAYWIVWDEDPETMLSNAEFAVIARKTVTKMEVVKK